MHPLPPTRGARVRKQRGRPLYRPVQGIGREPKADLRLGGEARGVPLCGSDGGGGVVVVGAEGGPLHGQGFVGLHAERDVGLLGPRGRRSADEPQQQQKEQRKRRRHGGRTPAPVAGACVWWMMKVVKGTCMWTGRGCSVGEVGATWWHRIPGCMLE